MICLIGNVLKERYCIVEQIGHGGGGSLYLAKDMELGICRAVKEISIAKKKEARLMQHLEYPAIPKIIDYVETGEYCYLIMEYIKGQSLGELLRSGKRFSLREILALGKEIARVLEYLHSRKPPVCYGDLKPDNLMFSETGQSVSDRSWKCHVRSWKKENRSVKERKAMRRRSSIRAT